MCIHEKKFVPKLQPKKLKFERRGVCGGGGQMCMWRTLKKKKNLESVKTGTRGSL
jgi:hypothetical protein